MQEEFVHPLIPAQQQGMKKDLVHTIVCEDTDDADDCFLLAKDRLLDVNNWKKNSAFYSAEFQLTDAKGNPVNRTAQKGDCIKIDIPGPGSETGKGYDWVHIEAIQYDDYPDDNEESIAMLVRSSKNPQSDNNATAHFFSNDATSSFIINRKGATLSATYHGRNEVANNDGSLLDTARNNIIALGAWAGFSDMQWKSLITGFLEENKNAPY